MESINSFSKGMNSDVSSQIHSPDSYLQALNFRGIANLGGSTGSLVNVKGNEHTITFPEIKDCYKLAIDPVLTGSKTTNGLVTITINGNTTGTISVSAGSTGLNIYNELKGLPNCFETTSGSPTAPQFAVSYLDNYVVIYQQPVYTLLTPAPTTLVISISLSNPTTATNTISFVDFANVTSNTQTTYLTGSDNLILIGSSYVDDSIYLLTAVDDDTEANPHPNDSFSNLGTIWKLDIDNVTKISTLTLIYNNNLDFTKYHPVSPTAILGRYESRGIQRLYWSDFYNSIKTLLVSDPQLMALNPTQISVFPAVSFEIPLLKEIITGSLTRGTYEAGYRLKKLTGAISNYSQTSNLVNLQGNETNLTKAGFNDYECDGSITNSGRGIRWNVWNIDTSWDTVEFFVLYRGNKTDLPIVYVVPPESISSSSPYLFEFTSITDLETITIEEYLTLSSGFTHAKTVETKDNILFWGNTKLVKQKQISDIFDARAFRAHSPGNPGTEDIILKNNGVFTTYTLDDATNTIINPNTNDSINQYYTSTGDIDFTNECYYKPGTSVLGGAGKYISYEFVTENILLSDLASTQGGTWFMNAVLLADPPYSYNTPFNIVGVPNPLDLIQGTTDSDNQTYPITGLSTSKNPYFTSVLKGYQQEEIYRFGIQFFDLQGVPYFTEWIGDIKMPSYNDPCNNLTALEIVGGVTDFKNSFFIPNSLYGRSLGIKFTVDVTAVANLISGYQIVRVERSRNNRTMLGYGMLTNVYKDTTAEFANIGGGMKQDDDPEYFLPPDPFCPLCINLGYSYWPWPNQDSVETLGQTTDNNDMTVSNSMLTFDCFDYMLGEFSHQAGDKMLIRSKVFPVNFRNVYADLLSSDTTRYRVSFFDNQAFLTNSSKATTPPSHIPPFYNISEGRFQTGFDAQEIPLFMLFYIDGETYPRDRSDVNRIIDKGIYCGAGSALTATETGVSDFHNYMNTYGTGPDQGRIPGQGAATMLTSYDSSNTIDSFNDFFATASNGQKLMALYYRPNSKQYNGNTYSNRSSNEYIACGSFIPLVKNNNLLVNNKIVTTNVFSGDVFINNWDLQKMIKDEFGVTYKYYPNDPPSSSETGSSIGLPTSTSEARMSNMFYIPCTNLNNQAVRGGKHFDRFLIDANFNYSNAIDEYVYDNFHSNEKTTTKFIPKPVEFIINDEFRNRIYFSNPKYDNETSDSWSAYPINQFYDVEGNYGGITSLVSLNQTVYFIQEKGFGMLMINPVSMVNDTTTGAPIKLGSSTTVIQKHFYKALDIGTKHQWSVYRSPNAVAFTDIRQKKIYIFDGESLKPISDFNGQRNFMFKRLHDNILNNDNPIIGKGLLTTFDYQNNEFLFTFKNNSTIPNPAIDENYTISYSEYLSAFVSMYSFTPNMYVNNNTNLLSIVNNNPKKLYLHNEGEYSKFYDVISPSTLKLIVNDNPILTKVFDDLVLSTEAINDNIEWSDDLNIYPGAITLPAYPDNVNVKDSTFDKVRFYNQYQNSDWTTLDPSITGNLRKVEQGFNLQIPRNKFNYDLYPVSTSSIFDPAKLTKIKFGDRLRDKWLNIDLSYNNALGLRFIVHNIKTLFRISDR